MTLEKIDVIDAAGVDRNGGELVLSIIDAWDWTDELGHLQALQAKLNAYFDFIESEQVFDAYPEAMGKAIRINLISRYPLPDSCKTFLKKAAAVASELNIAITQQDHPDTQI